MNSNYTALQINLSKRMGHGLQLQAAYTFSKALGYTTENNFLLNPFDRAANYGPAQFEPRRPHQVMQKPDRGTACWL